MKRLSRLGYVVACCMLLVCGWMTSIFSMSGTGKQLALMESSAAYIADGVYVRAAADLEESLTYQGDYTLQAEEALKEAYIPLLDQSTYSKKYIALLQTQMNRENPAPENFVEAATYYLSVGKIEEAITVLREGVEKTQDEALLEMYEENRYAYKLGYSRYEDVSSIYAGTIAVQLDGKWGIASQNGALLVLCEYDKISTMEDAYFIAEQDGDIISVNSSNNRWSLLKTAATEFGNYGQGLVALHIAEGVKLANNELILGTKIYQEHGMFSGGYAAAKQEGAWGVHDLQGEWLLPLEYDGIVMDELGRCYAQGAVFVEKSGSVYLTVDGEQIGSAYDDAKPFNDQGYAAVQKGGKWGFVNTAGEIVIACQFDNALSFGEHLAAVEIDGMWGYISLQGEVVIEPIFYRQKPFMMVMHQWKQKTDGALSS